MMLCDRCHKREAVQRVQFKKNIKFFCGDCIGKVIDRCLKARGRK